MNPSNTTQNILRIVAALVAIALLTVVLMENGVVTDKSPSDIPAIRLVTADGENEARHPHESTPQAMEPTPPDWALYLTGQESIKPVLGETYSAHPVGPPRVTNSPAAGPHLPE
jgi:hypothetical protein